MNRSYIAFISYRHSPLDTAVAERLQQKLERYRVPKELRREGESGLGLVFRDRDELPLSSDLSADICEALDHSRFLIVVCTPEAPKSVWVGREIEYFIRRHGRDHVLTVLAGGTPEESLPPLLTHIYAEDGRTVLQEVEPLSAYIVAGQTKAALKKLDREFLRLVAAILGCPYDALRQRQKRYQQRRISILLGTVFLVALCFVGMLAQKNLEVRSQLRATQRSESYARSLVSRQLLEQGDRHGAIENALAALPSGGDNRPLSAEAVQALTRALYAYGDKMVRFDAQLEQDTDICALALSPGGGYAVTIDAAGYVRGFDTGRETLLWQRQLPFRTDYEGNLTLDAFQVLEGESAVLCPLSGEAVLLSLETGKPLRTIAYTGDYDYSGDAVLSADGTRLAVHHQNSLGGPGSLEYDDFLVVYDTHTGGEISRTAVLPIPATMWYLDDFHFSQDNSFLAAGFFDSATCGYSALVVDAATGQVVNQYSFSVDAVAGAISAGALTLTDLDIAVSLMDDGGMLIYASYQIDFGEFEIISLQRVSPEGSVVFEQSYSYELNISAKQPAPAALQSSSTMCYVYSDCVLGVNLKTGRVEFQTALPAGLLYCRMFPEQARLLLVLSDGSIRCLTTYDGKLLDTAADGYSDCNFALSAAAGAQQDAPVLCVIPQQEPNRAILMRSLGDGSAVQLEAPLQARSDQAHSINLIGGKIYPFPSGEQLLVFDRDSSGEDGLTQYLFTIYDAASLEQTDSFTLRTEASLPLHPTGWSADETKVFFEAFVLDLTGHSLGMLEGWQERDFHYSYTANALPLSDQHNGQPQLTAYCTSDTLYWWRDGQMDSIPLSSGRSLSLYCADAPQDPVLIGSSGLVVLKHYSDDLDDRPAGYALYSIDEDTWTWLPNPSTSAGYPILCVGSAHPWMALADYDGTLRIYDQKADAVTRTLPLPVAANTIEDMRFLLEDGFLLIRTADARVLVVDAGDGTVRGRFSLENWSPYSTLTIQEDQTNHTLYLSDPYAKMTGLCIDTEFWIASASIPRLACVLPASHRTLSVDASGTTLQSYPVYTVEDLIQWGNNVLSGSG